ncbi:MAG: helix-turn-helix transcriptional regulator [Spirochaetes bacterium]|nr:helix-turn-helix transcriptional regulator [Spirochaetota bacterium]
MKTIKWVQFPPASGCTRIPQIIYAGMETVNTPSYRWDGMKRKSRPRCVFQYTIEGSGRLDYHGKTYDIPRGSAFIYDLSTPDSCYYYPPGAVKGWTFIYCAFSNFEDAVEQLNARHGPVYDFGEQSIVVERLYAMMEAQEKPGAPAGRNSFNVCAAIVGEMCRLADAPKNGGLGALAVKALAYIHEKRREHFSLEDLSHTLGVSPEHLCREFKKQLHCSPKQYHEKLRITAVCERLFSGGTIREVTKEFGFTDSSYFTKYFKKKCSITPAQFRKNRILPMHDIVPD